MPNLNQESKLITPSQALFFICLGSVFAVWYYDVDVVYHLGNIRETIHYVTAGIL
jgi:hypothetical protein